MIELLNQAAHPERNSVDNVIQTEEWQQLQQVFDSLGKFTLESFRTNRLPLLNLPAEILEALRSGRIAYTKARAIARVKDKVQRNILLEAALAEDLSLNQIKERIKSLSANENSTDNKKEESSLKNRMDKAYARAKKSKMWDDPKKKKQLEKLLTQLEALLGSD